MRPRALETKLIVEYLWDGTLQSPVLALERQNFVFMDNIPPSWLLMPIEDLDLPKAEGHSGLCSGGCGFLASLNKPALLMPLRRHLAAI